MKINQKSMFLDLTSNPVCTCVHKTKTQIKKYVPTYVCAIFPKAQYNLMI